MLALPRRIGEMLFDPGTVAPLSHAVERRTQFVADAIQLMAAPALGFALRGWCIEIPPPAKDVCRAAVLRRRHRSRSGSRERRGRFSWGRRFCRHSRRDMRELA